MTYISPFITRHGFGITYILLEAVLSVMFCALVMHGLKTSNPKMILPSLVFIPINTMRWRSYGITWLLVALSLAPWISFYRVYKFFKLGENAEAGNW